LMVVVVVVAAAMVLLWLRLALRSIGHRAVHWLEQVLSFCALLLGRVLCYVAKTGSTERTQRMSLIVGNSKRRCVCPGGRKGVCVDAAAAPDTQRTPKRSR
jgi:hypothetical protein